VSGLLSGLKQWLNAKSSLANQRCCKLNGRLAGRLGLFDLLGLFWYGADRALPNESRGMSDKIFVYETIRQLTHTLLNLVLDAICRQQHVQKLAMQIAVAHHQSKLEKKCQNHNSAENILRKRAQKCQLQISDDRRKTGL